VVVTGGTISDTFTITTETIGATTWHTTALHGSGTLTSVNRTVTFDENSSVYRTVDALSGKKVFAVTFVADGGANDIGGIGFCTVNVGNSPGFTDTGTHQSWTLYTNPSNPDYWLISNSAAVINPTVAWTEGDTVGLVIDYDNAVFWFTVDGTTYYGSGGTGYTRAQVEAGTGGIDFSSVKASGTLYGLCGYGWGGAQFTINTSWPWTTVSGYSVL
jgi:hypothetical protein